MAASLLTSHDYYKSNSRLSWHHVTVVRQTKVHISSLSQTTNVVHTVALVPAVTLHYMPLYMVHKCYIFANAPN